MDGSLERAQVEMEALKAIYDEDFVVLDSKAGKLRFQLTIRKDFTLHGTLPQGYPESATAQVFATGLATQQATRDLSTRLQSQANDLVGQEAILDLVQTVQEYLDELVDKKQEEDPENNNNSKASSSSTSTTEPQKSSLTRCWIWVHHIVDTSRIKSIVSEARSNNLGGYIKPGYPGIVLVEGRQTSNFVKWIKGSKSLEGGFGRNWGHHVRGEICNVENRQLPEDFIQLEADMKQLGQVCKEAGLEDEFLEYVLQHK